MLYLTCTTITSVDLAHYGVSRAKDWVSIDCVTKTIYPAQRQWHPEGDHGKEVRILVNKIVTLQCTHKKK